MPTWAERVLVSGLYSVTFICRTLMLYSARRRRVGMRQARTLTAEKNTMTHMNAVDTLCALISHARHLRGIALIERRKSMTLKKTKWRVIRKFVEGRKRKNKRREEGRKYLNEVTEMVKTMFF